MTTDGVALVDESVQDIEQFADIFEVQACGWLIENIERASGLDFGEFTGEFDSL